MEQFGSASLNCGHTPLTLNPHLRRAGTGGARSREDIGAPPVHRTADRDLRRTGARCRFHGTEHCSQAKVKGAHCVSSSRARRRHRACEDFMPESDCRDAGTARLLPPCPRAAPADRCSSPTAGPVRGGSSVCATCTRTPDSPASRTAGPANRTRTGYGQGPARVPPFLPAPPRRGRGGQIVRAAAAHRRTVTGRRPRGARALSLAAPRGATITRRTGHGGAVQRMG